MKRYNVGIIGIGDISDVYINNLKKYDIVNLYACASRGLEKAVRKAEQHNIPKPCASADELLADPDIDIVLNLTVPSVHTEINLAVLEAGKHLYTEKPLGTDWEGANRIMALAKAKGLYLGAAPDTFMGGRLQTCRALIEDGTLGEIVGAGAYCLYHGAEHFHPNPYFFYQPGGGPLLDIGPYYMTALLSLMGPVKRVSAMSSRTFPTRRIEALPKKGEIIEVEMDTHIIGNLEFKSGALASMTTSFDVWDSEMPRIEIYGTKGTICIKDVDPLDGPNLFGGPVLLRTPENYRWYGFPRDENPSDWINVPVKHRFNSTVHSENSRGIGLVDMAYAIRDGRAPRASSEMAYHSMEVMDGMLRSASEGRFFDIKSNFVLPAPLPVDFPESEG